MRNTIRLKLSSPELIDRYGLTWILRRQHVTALRWPRIAEPVTVVTAPTGFARGLMTFRDFHLLDQQGRAIVSATTDWLLMDLDSRRLRPIPESVLAIRDDFPDEADCLPRPTGKLQPPEPETGLRHFRVPYYQLDFNNHLTNPSYPELLLEPLGASFLNGHLPTKIDLAYHHEARYGEELTAVTGPTGNGFAHALRRQGKELATMHSSWEKIAPAFAP